MSALCAQGSLLSYLLSAEGCGRSPLRAGMTSVGVGRVTRYCIVHACCQRVECLPLACCCKNVFRDNGVHVDTVALSLLLASIWNFLVGGGRGVIGWRHLRKRELLLLGYKELIGYSCCVAPGERQPLCCPGCLALTIVSVPKDSAAHRNMYLFDQTCLGRG